MATWNTLPREIQLYIWKQLIPCPIIPEITSDPSEEPEDPENHLVTAKTGFTNYVLVCKEWQKFFEEENFRRLPLHQDYVDGLDELSPSRQRLIKHIWLRVELDTYDCRRCALQRGRLCDVEVATGLLKLFTALASRKWVEKSTDGGGLTFELSAHSPSDSKHALRGIHTRNLLPMGQQRIELNDPSHTERLNKWQMCALVVVFAPIRIGFRLALPMVKGIKTFLIRRHNRHIFAMESLRQILLKLNGLEKLTIESWQWPFASESFGEASIETMPRRLRSLSLFEDHIRDTTVYPDLCQVAWDDCRARRSRGMVLAERSLGLEKLSVSFIVEADAFFQRACEKPKWVWEQLEQLTLTSQLLSTGESVDAINRMLQAAATTALRMPKLVTMELWNGREHLAGVFRYSVSRAVGGVATIAWQGTLDLALHPETIKAWQDVTHEHIGLRELRVEKLLMSSEEVQSHGDAFHLLKIDRHAIHPESLHQIRTENGFCYFP